MDYENRLLPYLSLLLVIILFFYFSSFITDSVIRNVLLGVATSGVFFFVAYLFFDVVRHIVIKKELKYIEQHIRQEISSNVLIALYTVKKIIYGYNLNTNKFKNIIGITELNNDDILRLISNQNYIGFQIFKSGHEIAYYREGEHRLSLEREHPKLGYFSGELIMQKCSRSINFFC
jgi:hypothetical protein